MQVIRTDKHIELIADEGKALRRKGTTRLIKRAVLPMTGDINQYEDVEKGDTL